MLCAIEIARARSLRLARGCTFYLHRVSRHAAIDERENRGVITSHLLETRCWENARAANYGPSLGDDGQALPEVRSNNGLAAAF
jgi:hypothetical protein